MNWFWAKVLFGEYIRHYRKLDDAAIVADVRQSMDDLEELRAAGESFGAFMVRKAESRTNSNRARYADYGKLGGRPRKQQQNLAVRVSGSGDAGDASARTTAPGLDFDTTRTRAGESADNGSSSNAQANGGSARGERTPDAPGATEGFLIPSAPDPAPARSRKNLPAVGEFRNVRISEGETAALVAEFGDVSAIVEELSSYKAATGRNYKNDYAALRNWLRRRNAEGKRPDGKRKTQGERMAEYFARREIEIEMLDRERAGDLPAEYGVTDDESY